VTLTNIQRYRMLVVHAKTRYVGRAIWTVELAIDGTNRYPAGIRSSGRGKTVSRSVDFCEETVTVLREHKRHHAELKMANREHGYHDLGLVFAREWAAPSRSRGFVGAAAPIKQSRSA
jgi:hypothetical protein